MALDEPRYCELCRMWLNGDAQYSRHLKCRKHNRKLRGKRVQDWCKDIGLHAQPQVDTAVAAQNNQTRPQNNQTRRARSCGAVREKGPLEPR